jgi:regulator of protease activity HflC (stomatin/prohibitin superfamily)
MACGIFPCVTVNTGTVALIEQFGKFTKIAKPGLNFVIPCFCEFPAATVSMRLQQMEVSCETKTKDNVFVLIRVAVQYQVNDDEESIKNAHYRLTNPRQQIESYVFDVVRSSVPKIDLDDVFTTKEEIAQNIKSELTSAMSSFGYTILASPITDIDPDKEVKRAMNDINKAKRLRLAAQDEGEAVKIKAVKEAEAEAARTEIQAKADAEAKFLAGQGIARQRQAIMEGLRESVNAFKSEVQDVDAKTVMDLMIVTQYFDMMRDVGAHSKTNAVFLNHSPGALEDLAQAVQKGFMAAAPNPGSMLR